MGQNEKSPIASHDRVSSLSLYSFFYIVPYGYQPTPSDSSQEDTAYPRPVTVGYGVFEKVIESTFSDIRNGVDVKESLDMAVDQLNAQLSIYK